MSVQYTRVSVTSHSAAIKRSNITDEGSGQGELNREANVSKGAK
ncbi:hypothetical protein B2J93_3939 [Marssonina coronariae]|uniref:Uncharacterized protein n=1 Tax=Diplocarpon coronariae TaxID=2795749 RepID=A0A218YX19_9HELO|nr:hypothetical protein B2J93_3939 [Marssonina coronariae]